MTTSFNEAYLAGRIGKSVRRKGGITGFMVTELSDPPSSVMLENVLVDMDRYPIYRTLGLRLTDLLNLDTVTYNKIIQTMEKRSAANSKIENDLIHDLSD
jgi:hypothetical protein